MFEAFGQFFAAFTVLFQAFTRVANSINHLAAAAEAAAEEAALKGALERQANIRDLKAKLNLEDKSIVAEQ